MASYKHVTVWWSYVRYVQRQAQRGATLSENFQFKESDQLDK